MSSQAQILVVDDDREITELIAAYLSRFGFSVRVAHDGTGMRAHLAQTDIHLIVLDIMMPGSDGLALAREVRATSRTPIILLSARADHYDRVLGLDLGADDYMCKPCEPRELVARIQTILRRTEASGSADPQADPLHPMSCDVVRFDGWMLNRHERRVTSPSGLVTPISNAEYRLLNAFLSMPRRVCGREQLMQQVRGRHMESFERSIDLLVSRLRQKLSSDAGAQSLIKTVRGIGYMFAVNSVHAVRDD